MSRLYHNLKGNRVLILGTGAGPTRCGTHHFNESSFISVVTVRPPISIQVVVMTDNALKPQIHGKRASYGGLLANWEKLTKGNGSGQGLGRR